ncbi:hypothetical protein JXA47_08450 [Candidatus Sumerlaeota bacterium]|nr:hypothetical protein [Candidatus Sumerlaeota bacterium]
MTTICLAALITGISAAQETEATTETVATDETESPPDTLMVVIPDEMVFAAPALVTTVGRADGTIVHVICRRAGIDSELIEEVQREDLDGIGTLVVAMGGSTKGLGAAGVDADTEVERGEEVLAMASVADVPILGVHVGGTPRRGELSDEFCEVVAEAADALIVKAGGNEDGFFTEIAERRDIPLIEVGTNAEAIEALADLFGVAEDQ